MDLHTIISVAVPSTFGLLVCAAVDLLYAHWPQAPSRTSEDEDTVAAVGRFDIDTAELRALLVEDKMWYPMLSGVRSERNSR